VIQLLGIVTLIAAVANPVAGTKWETAAQTDGIVFARDGRAMFYNQWHQCPVLWATYVVQRESTVVVTGTYHRVHRILTLDVNGLLHDGTNVYHRVPDIAFPPPPAGTTIGC